MEIEAGILTISDRCSEGKAQDLSGPILRAMLDKQGWKCAMYRIVPDDPEKIREHLISWADREKLPLILTTGGTGVGPRDITPETTRSLIEKELSGVSELMRLEGLKHTPFACLSRGVSGVRGKTLILNLPGSPKGAEESFEAVLSVVPHILSTLAGNDHEESAHEESGCHAVHHAVHHARSAVHKEKLLPVGKAMQIMLSSVQSLPAEKIKLIEAEGGILTEALYAKEDLPLFDNSAVDGYAIDSKESVKAAENTPVEFLIQDKIPAGSFPTGSLQKGAAVRIMTGAPVPPGADAVIMQEFTISENHQKIKVLKDAKPGENIRRKGEDVKKGDLLLSLGDLLRPYEIALLASQGFTEVSVVKKIKAAVISTGDELVEFSEPISFGKIRNSNTPAVSAALKKRGIELLDYGSVSDQPEKLKTVFKEALENSDAVLISGGVSVGELDYTREILFKLGVKEVFWKVAVRPGKPFFFGMYQDSKPVFGLPGNPISTLVCLEELVLPVLEKMMGKTEQYPRYPFQGKVLNHYTKPSHLLQYLFCKTLPQKNEFGLKIFNPQGSHRMGMASQANALAVAPEGMDEIEPGSLLPFRWLT